LGTVRTTDTRYFTDPSIATVALGLGPGDLMTDETDFTYFVAGVEWRF